MNTNLDGLCHRRRNYESATLIESPMAPTAICCKPICSLHVKGVASIRNHEYDLSGNASGIVGRPSGYSQGTPCRRSCVEGVDGLVVYSIRLQPATRIHYDGYAACQDIIRRLSLRIVGIGLPLSLPQAGSLVSSYVDTDRQSSFLLPRSSSWASTLENTDTQGSTTHTQSTTATRQRKNYKASWTGGRHKRDIDEEFDDKELRMNWRGQ